MRIIARILRTALLFASALATLLGPRAALAARSDWRELTVGRYHIYSTLRDGRTRAIAAQLQVFDKTAGELIKGPDPLPDVPTYVYLLGREDFEKYAADRPGLGGFFAERRYANLMVVNGDMDFDFTKVSVLHEFTHYIQRTTYEVTLPTWFMEGFAELISSFHLHDNVVTIGMPPDGLSFAVDSWIPIERILAVKQSDREYRAEQLMPQFYGEAWTLVHYLLFDTPELVGPTSTYLRNLDAGIPEPQAFAASFPFDKRALDTSVRSLLRGSHYHIRRLTYGSAVTSVEVPITRLTVPQADAAFLRMLFLMNPAKPVLGELAAQALRENPADPDVQALVVRVAAHRNEPVQFAEQITRITGEAESGREERIDLADALLASKDVTTEQQRAARDLLQPLIDSGTYPVEAAALWAPVALQLGDDPERLASVLEATTKRVPHNTMLLGRLADAYVRLNRLDKARACYERIMLVSPWPDERRWAQKQADSPRMQAVPPEQH